MLARAVHYAETEGLRAYDAVQLAVAVELQTRRLASGLSAMTLVSADQELNAAAAAAGLRVEDPGVYP